MRVELPSRKIVLADDDATTREGLAVLLRDEGYVVEVAVDGAEALALCRRDRPDLLVTDLDMPKLRGDALIAELRASDPELKVAVITGEHSRDAGRRAAALGVAHYFRKPLDLDDLLGRIAAMLRVNA